MARGDAAHQKLVEANPQLAHAVIGWEVALRTGLAKARKAQGYEQWQVAEKLGWPLKKVHYIEDIGTELSFKDLRRYLLATGLVVSFQISTDKSLG